MKFLFPFADQPEALKALLKGAALSDMRFHDLRHSAVAIMLQEGIHPKIVQERLGHSQISVTLDTYSHVLPSMQEGVASLMDEVLTAIQLKLPVDGAEEVTIRAEVERPTWTGR